MRQNSESLAKLCFLKIIFSTVDSLFIFQQLRLTTTCQWLSFFFKLTKEFFRLKFFIKIEIMIKFLFVN